MSVNDNNRNAQQQTNQAQAQPQTTDQGAPQFSNVGGGRSWTSLMQRAMPRNNAAESIARIHALMVDNYGSKANQQIPYNIDVHILDERTVPSLQVPAIVVAASLKDQKGAVGYYTMPCASAVEGLKNRTEHIAGNQIEVLTVVGDVLGQNYTKQIAERMMSMYPGRTLVSADAMVIDRDFSPTTPLEAHPLAVQAMSAIEMALEMSRKDWKDLNLAEIDGNNILTFKTTFAPSEGKSVTNQPVRNDIQIAITAMPPSQRARTDQVVENFQQGTHIATVGGYVEMLPIQPENRGNGFAQEGQKFKARFVTTVLESALTTPGAVLLALVSLYTLYPNQRWLSAYRNRGLPAELVLNDIGALNMAANVWKEANGGTFLNTSAADFGTDALWKFAAQCIEPDPIISLDVEESGSQTYFLRLFAAAAEGSTAAVAAIYEAAQRLTNGNMAVAMKANNLPITTNPFINEGNRVYLGKFNDAAGNPRDIRAIDYTAIGTLTRKPEMARDFIETYLRTQVDAKYRAAVRNKIYAEILPQGWDVTGAARRFTLRLEWFNCLVQAISQTGMNVRDDTESVNQYFNSANANFLVSGSANTGALFGGAGGGNLFSMGGMTGMGSRL